MYQMFGDILTISVNDWMAAGLTYDQFRWDSRDGYLTIAKRGIKGNTLIDAKSIRRPERRAAIEATHGKIQEAEKQTSFMDVVVSPEAVEFFKNYTYTDKDGKELHLPVEAQKQYSIESAILDMLKRVMTRQMTARASSTNKKTKKSFWENAVVKVEQFAADPATFNKLPRNERSLERKYNEYHLNGFQTLVHGMYGKNNSEKLTEAAKFWLIARFATPVNRVTVQQLWIEYNAEVEKHEDWKKVTEAAIRIFLERPEIKPLWYGMRHGELNAKEKYTRINKTLLPTRRDSLWYGDGTKLNYYYRDDDGNVCTCNVYEVIDVYSEVLLGYHISSSEDFEAQYFAYRMAMQFSGHKPNEIRYDNQGGHKKLNAGQFFAKLAHLNIPTQPYNGRSKTIESVFGRFQSQYLHRDWFFTGQNITAKKEESRANMEFILANKSNLPTLDEIKTIYKKRREEWNNSEHFDTGKRRIDMYLESVNDKTKAVDFLDMIEMFGIVDSIPNTYTASGIKKTIKGREYQWEVLKDDNTPDYDFLRNNIERKFYIGYDLNDMTMVALYTKDAKGLRFVTYAQKYIEIHRAKQDQDEFDHAFIKATENANKQMRIDMQNQIEDILEMMNMHPVQHGLSMPKPKGLNLTKKDQIGSYTKKVSNMQPVDVEDKY